MQKLLQPLFQNSLKNILKTSTIARSKCAKPLKSKAAVKYGDDSPFEIQEVDVDSPKKGEVRIKLAASGICHTDAYNFGDFETDGKFPCIRGHEGAGVVESVGQGVKKFKCGDHVIPIFMPECKQCSFCKSGRTNLCTHLAKHQPKGIMKIDGKTRFSMDGETIYHFMGTSTFSQYTVVDQFSLIKINKDACLEKVCIMGCGIPTGYGSALNIAKVKKGSTCAVWGLGTVGNAAIMGCKKAGAKKIFGIDLNEKKAKLACKFGMTDFINACEFQDMEKQCIIERLNKISKGGFDFTLECIGNVQTMAIALEATKPWGTAVVVGVDPKRGKICTSPPKLLLGRKWKGGAFGGWKISQIPPLVDEYVCGKLMVDEFITDSMPLCELNEAYGKMMKGKCLKAVVTLEDDD